MTIKDYELMIELFKSNVPEDSIFYDAIQEASDEELYKLIAVSSYCSGPSSVLAENSMFVSLMFSERKRNKDRKIESLKARTALAEGTTKPEKIIFQEAIKNVQYSESFKSMKILELYLLTLKAAIKANTFSDIGFGKYEKLLRRSNSFLFPDGIEIRERKILTKMHTQASKRIEKMENIAEKILSGRKIFV